MKNFKYLLFAITILIATTCKKKPDAINVKVIDPFINKPIGNAKVGLIERELKGSISGGGYECAVIKSAETNANGEVIFENVKFKTSKSVAYFITVLNAYGKELSYSCGNHKEADLLQKTSSTINKTVYAYGRTIDWKINLNKLNTQGFGNLNSDSIMIMVNRDFNYFDDFINNWNGSKQFVDKMFLNKTNYQAFYTPSNPETYSCCPYNYLTKIHPGNYRLKVFKNKNGINSSYEYNEIVTPFDDVYFFNIDW